MSGVKSIFINGYEFTEDQFIRGELNVRLQQFDGTYPYFVVQTLDYAGNRSDVYTCINPYYVAPEDLEDNESMPYFQLPITAMPTAPTDAVGDVTEHMEVDENGDMIIPNYNSDQGKSFYTISTETGKVFYLIVDRSGTTEQVYFLTEISENDLLNVTRDTNATIGFNSVAATNNVQNPYQLPPAVTAADISENQRKADEIDNPKPAPVVSENSVSENNIPEPTFIQKNIGNIMIGIGAVVFFVIAYFVKIKGKKKDRKFSDEAIAEEEEEDIEEE